MVRTSSSFTCPTFGTSCDFTYRLEYLSIDPTFARFDVTWDGTAGGINLQSTFGFDVGIGTRTWVSELLHSTALANPAVKANRPLAFSNFVGVSPGLINVRANGDYYAHPAQTAVDQSRGVIETMQDALNSIADSVGLSTSIEENPTLATFTSTVTLVAPDLYDYRYNIVNLTDQPLVYDWRGAEKSGEVAAMSTEIFSFLTSTAPSQSHGFLAATVNGGAMLGPATTIVPTPAAIPEPASLLLLVTGLAAAGVFGRRSGHRAARRAVSG